MTASTASVCSEKAAYWSEHVTAWQRSGLSQGAYCRQHGLSQSSLSYWRKRLGATNDRDRDAASFVTIVPVPLSASTQPDIATPPEPMLVHVGNAFCIEIRGDFAAPVLEKLVLTLARL